ncbi:bifunctional GNAT family N-acetyltransferase/NUDIX hydrolase [Janibacter alittae]|uniref:Bifunctional GNAT family N-acetyltransferase/NUDIX hydrolase n=1 Tax=Janibacter alittae TaxID=3115209 RepID=A0ABZ2MDI0_9MICO
MPSDSAATVRPVLPGDPALADLAAIEDAGLPMFTEIMDTSGWRPAPTGAARAERAGFLLVAGEPPEGFVHVLDLDGHAHLEQLSVRPDRMRAGVGRALVRAALIEAARRGHDELTLCTYVDVAWNAPFYRQLGFREVEEAHAPESVLAIRAQERAAGLDDGGRRVIMRVPLATTVVEPRPAVSVIPLRDGTQGLEVFVQHRQATMDFAAGAVVFPGGRCDAADTAAGHRLPLPAGVLDDHVRRWAATSSGARAVEARTLLATGLRELQEETGLVADPSALVPWDRWVTPEIVPTRFDVAFYVLHVPRDAVSQPRHSTTEATRSGWEPVVHLLEGLETGRVTMLTPTRVIVEELAWLGVVDAVMALRPVITTVRDDHPAARPRPGGEPRTGVRPPRQGR